MCTRKAAAAALTFLLRDGTSPDANAVMGVGGSVRVRRRGGHASPVRACLAARGSVAGRGAVWLPWWGWGCENMVSEKTSEGKKKIAWVCSHQSTCHARKQPRASDGARAGGLRGSPRHAWHLGSKGIGGGGNLPRRNHARKERQLKQCAGSTSTEAAESVRVGVVLSFRGEPGAAGSCLALRRPTAHTSAKWAKWVSGPRVTAI